MEFICPLVFYRAQAEAINGQPVWWGESPPFLLLRKAWEIALKTVDVQCR